MDGLYDVTKDEPVFHRLFPTDEEIRVLVETLSKQILRLLKRNGYPVDDGRDATGEEDEIFLDVQTSSVQSLIALVKRRWQKVRRLGVIDWGSFDGAVLEGERCVSDLSDWGRSSKG